MTRGVGKGRARRLTTEKTTTPITIRPARAADAPFIADLLGQLGYPAAAEEIPERLTRLEAHEHAIVLVAVDGTDVVGVITGHSYPSLHAAKPVAYLTSLVVAEGHRGKAIGSELAKRIEEWAKARGAVRLSVTSAMRRTETHGFYERRGYDRSGLRFTKPL
jgi:GNAT superfamily N-acetyltransferase